MANFIINRKIIWYAKVWLLLYYPDAVCAEVQFVDSHDPL